MIEPVVKLGTFIPVVVLRHDEEGRAVIQCFVAGHEEELVADSAGTYQCPLGAAQIAAMAAVLGRALDRLILGSVSD